jgi:hypothetical protein
LVFNFGFGGEHGYTERVHPFRDRNGLRTTGLPSSGYTRERMLSDYNLVHGGLMGFGLLFMLFAPLLGAKLNQGRMR